MHGFGVKIAKLAHFLSIDFFLELSEKFFMSPRGLLALKWATDLRPQCTHWGFLYDRACRKV